MKTLNIVCLSCFVVCFVSCKEQKKNSIVDPIFQDHVRLTEGVKNSLNSVQLIFTKSLIEPNEGVLDSITDDQLSYGHSSGLIQNKSEFINDVVHGEFDFVTIDISQQEIIYTNNLAVVRHVFDSKAISKGNDVQVKIGVMLVWSYSSKRWKLIARQAYRFKK